MLLFSRLFTAFCKVLMLTEKKEERFVSNSFLDIFFFKEKKRDAESIMLCLYVGYILPKYSANSTILLCFCL